MLKSKLHWFKVWRSKSWHKGHEDGYKYAMQRKPDEEAFNKRTQAYYYRHINQCQQTKHVCLQETTDAT